jgi:hypothetical protein
MAATERAQGAGAGSGTRWGLLHGRGTARAFAVAFTPALFASRRSLGKVGVRWGKAGRTTGWPDACRRRGWDSVVGVARFLVNSQMEELLK